jgi:PIN domain nuclease of toxin-antitoxin system
LKLLLDTHALIWWWLDDPQLSPAARKAIGDDSNAVCVSAASAWEILTKQRRGKLPGLPADLVSSYSGLLAEDGFQPLAISTAHALLAGNHPAEHRDPFDRMLAAQAEIEGAVLVTRDPAFGQFEVRTLW